MARAGKTPTEAAAPTPAKPVRRLALGAAVAATTAALVAGAIMFLESRDHPTASKAGASSSPTALSSPAASGIGLYRIDPVAGHVATQVAGGPGGNVAAWRLFGVTVVEGFVWTLDPSGVRKINPDTNKPIATIPLGPGTFDSRGGAGAVWAEKIEGNRVVLYRIDPRTNGYRKIPRVSLPQDVGGTSLPTSLAVEDAAVWLADLARETVLRVDPRSLSVEELPLPSGTDQIVAGEGQLWVRDNGPEASVSRLDPATGRVIRKIPLAGGADGLAIGGGYVYVADSTNDTVIQIDPVTNSAFATIRVGDGPRDLAWGEGFLWVVNLVSGTVSKVDPRTHAQVAVIRVPATGGIAVGEGSVWVASCGRLQSGTPCS